LPKQRFRISASSIGLDKLDPLLGLDRFGR